jgi:membrane protein required for colicin V production
MNWVDWVILGIAGASLLAGLMRGAVRTVFSVVGLVLGFVVASRESGAVGMVLAKGMPEPAAAAVGFVAVFLGIALAVSLAGWLLRKVLQGLALGWLDRGLGGVLGLLRAAAILGVLALATESIGPFPAAERSLTYPWALESGRWLLHLIPEETLDRLDWDGLKSRIPGGPSGDGEII